MDRSSSIGKEAKFHINSEEGRFLGTLCCRAEDVLRAGAVLSGELHIKRVQRFDTRGVEKGHRKLRMFLQRKDTFVSQESRQGFLKMMTAFIVFLDGLREGGKCAVLSDEVVLAVGEVTPSASTLPQEPVVFLHIPLRPPSSPPIHSPSRGDAQGGWRSAQAAPTPSPPIGGQGAIPASSTSPPRSGGRTAMPDTSKSPRQPSPPGSGGQKRLPRRDPVPSGDAGAGVGRGRGTDTNPAIPKRGSGAGEGAVSSEAAAALPGPRQPPQHMRRTSQGWVDILKEGALSGAHALPPSGAGVGRGKAVDDISPGRERRLISRRGRGAGGAVGQGNDNPPALANTPSSRVGVGKGSAPRKPKAGGTVGGGARGQGDGDPSTPADTSSSRLGVGKGSAPRKVKPRRAVDGGASGRGNKKPPTPTDTGSRDGVGKGSARGDNNPPAPAFAPISRGGGAVGGGTRGQDGDNPATAFVTPSSRVGEDKGGASKKLTAGGAVDGGDRGGGSAVNGERRVLERRLSRSASFVNDSYYIILADKRHTWAFGAIAELIHNSSDARATEVRISLENLGPEDDTNFVVVDDGHGMTHEDMAQLFTIGKDYGNGPTAPAGERIGCNGVGFKQGVLRLGDTAVVVSVRGKVPMPDLPLEDIPTATFGILSIEPYRRSLATKQEREPVVLQYATLNLLTMQADERYNSQEEYEAVLGIIRSLVPYFTREYLATYVARFVAHDDRNAWKIRGVKSSTSIFVSRLRKSPNHGGRHRFELIEDFGGTDIRLEDRKGGHTRLPNRPRSCSESGKLSPPMDYSLRSFCKQIFLDPTKMKIYVQGSEVKPAKILRSLEEKETFDFDIFKHLEQDEIIDCAHEGRIAFSEEHGPSPPYNITVHVGQDRWHRENELSGVMTYFENCLVDSYARGQGLPDVVPQKELGYLAIVSFSGPSDKRLFHPNPTKVGFPTDNDRYICVLEAAGEALTQVIQNVNVPNETPLAENEELDNWIECYRCGKSRKVSQEYYDQNEASQTWHCSIEGSPVPLPEEGSNKCETVEDQDFGRTVHYKPSATVSRVADAPREVFSMDFTIEDSRKLGEGSSASVFAGCGYEGEGNALKVFKDKAAWRREKDILWALAKAPGKDHSNVCSLAWICPDKLTLALKPFLPGSCSLSDCMQKSESHSVLTNHVRLGIAEKVADALRHLHKRKFCHNDVQPENIVLGRNPKEDVLLVDFGQACRFSKKHYSSKTPLRYAPPEVLKGGGIQTRGECDMFGFGVTMVELFAGQTLFGSDTVRNEAKLKESLRALEEKGNLVKVHFEDLKETLPGLRALRAKDGMKPLARICRACVNGDADLRAGSEGVVLALANFRGDANFHWRHGTNIVYHTLEPGDRLHFSGDGVLLGQTRLPHPSGKVVSIKDHIKHGSSFGYRSQCISCSLTLAFCIFYAQKQHSMFMAQEYGLAPILEIDLSKLRSKDSEKHVFDGTNQNREGGTAMDTIAENFAGDAEEVIIDGIGVPSAAITAVWSLDFTPRTRESSIALSERAGQLEKLHHTLSPHAGGRSSTFSKWEKHFNKFIRRKGNGNVSSLDLVKKQARVPNLSSRKGGVEEILRASYCARHHGVESPWPSGGVAVGRDRGASAGGASSGRVAAARRGSEDGAGVTGSGAKGKKRGQPAEAQRRPKPPKSARVPK